MPGISGNVGVGPAKVSVDESFVDVVDQSDWLIALFARLDARKARIGFYADGGYKAVREDFTSGSGAREFEWDTTLHGLILGMSFTF